MYQERFESIQENKVEKKISPCTRSTLQPNAKEFIVTSPEKISIELGRAELSSLHTSNESSTLTRSLIQKT